MAELGTADTGLDLPVPEAHHVNLTSPGRRSSLSGETPVQIQPNTHWTAGGEGRGTHNDHHDLEAMSSRGKRLGLCKDIADKGHCDSQKVDLQLLQRLPSPAAKPY